MGNPLPVTVSLLRWTRAWASEDPQEAHWHLGPVAVDRHLQGHGIGTALLRTCCAGMDGRGSAVYLEADQAANVTFYERFGFRTLRQCPVLGVPNWFMLRAAG